MAKPAISGLLAILLLAAVAAAASPSLHQWVHSSSDGGHLCLVCTFCKSQIVSADVTPICAVLSSVFVFSIPSLNQVLLPPMDLRLASPRGPPSHPSLA